MRAKRIYNNNVIMGLNKDGEEVILVGRGLAFGLKKEQKVTEEKIEKKFELKGNANNRFQQLIQDVPIEYILLCEEVIKYIKKNSQKEISDFIYVTLTDHIVTMIERIQKGIDFDTVLLLNIRSLYPEEYQISLQVVEMLRKELNLNIEDTEAYFITLHIVNAETNSNMMDLYTITSIIEKISNIVDKYFVIEKENNFPYDRFLTHCRFFVQRVINKEYLPVKDPVSKEMLDLMIAKYTKQYECVKEIVQFIEENYHYKVAEDEQLYLLIHLNKLTK